jgi:hypothetical protein
VKNGDVLPLGKTNGGGREAYAMEPIPVGQSLSGANYKSSQETKGVKAVLCVRGFLVL